MRFDRTTLTLAELLERRPLAAYLMFRNVNLNPGDTYIMRSVRSELTGFLERFSSELEELERIKGEQATKEFRELRNRGAVRTEPLGAYKTTLSPEDKRAAEATEEWLHRKLAEHSGRSVEEIRRDPSTVVFVPDLMFKGKEKPVAWSHSGGQLQTATERELPVTASVLESIDFLTIECAAAVCGWFSQSGTIDPNGAQRLLQEFGETERRRKQ